MQVALRFVLWAIGLALAAFAALYLVLLIAGPACGCADGPDQGTSEWYSANRLKHPPRGKPTPQRERTLEETGL